MKAPHHLTPQYTPQNTESPTANVPIPWNLQGLRPFYAVLSCKKWNTFVFAHPLLLVILHGCLWCPSLLPVKAFSLFEFQCLLISRKTITCLVWIPTLGGGIRCSPNWGWRNPPLFWQRSHDAMGGTLLEACVFVLASGNCGCNGRRWLATAATLLLDDWFGGYDKPTPYKWLNSVVYGRCNKLVFMGLITNKHHWGAPSCTLFDIFI